MFTVLFYSEWPLKVELLLQDASGAVDSKQLVKRLADSEVELQKCQSSCRELEDRVAALDDDNRQLKAQLVISKDQLDRIQHQLFEERKVSPPRSASCGPTESWRTGPVCFLAA